MATDPSAAAALKARGGSRALQTMLVIVALTTLAAVVTTIVATLRAGEAQFAAEQRVLARQLADRVGDVLTRVEIASSTLDLHELPSGRAAADRWLAARSAAYRIDRWVALRVESREGTLLAAAGRPVSDHHHHGAGVLVCPRCLREGRMLPVRGTPDPAGRTVELRLSLPAVGRQLLRAAAPDRSRAARLIGGGGVVLASSRAREVGSREPVLERGERGRAFVGTAPVAARGSAIRVALSADRSHATATVRQAVSAEIAAGLLLVFVLVAGAALVLRERHLHWHEERQALEARARAERAAADADRLASIGTLAASLVHEISNPLACITANLDYVAGAGALAAEGREALGDARDSAERVSELVRDLRVLARGPEQAPELVDVAGAMRSALRIAAHQIRARARLTTDLEEGVPAVRANASRLSQVFLNLIVNAVQAIPEGSPEAHEIRVSVGERAGRVVAEVTDTGQGIAPEVAARIFEPFFTTKPPGVGTGLGLSICREIVAAYGGEVSVRSEPRRGSTFGVSLPARAPDATCESTIAPGSPEASAGS